MPHVFEPAPTNRSKCRACGRTIGKGEVRWGERIANPFGEGEATLWFHPLCAAWRRPEPLLASVADPACSQDLVAIAQRALAHPRLCRIAGAERSSSSRSKCRSCKEPIAKGQWRVVLSFFEDSGRFAPGGFVHATCARGYFECEDLSDAVLHFAPSLDDTERDALRAAVRS